MTLDEESSKFTTIKAYSSTIHCLLECPLQLECFQRTMENLLQGIPQVTVRMDDILISGKGENAPIYTNGWPHHCQDVQLHPYLSRKAELTIESGSVLWGNRVIVPPQGRAQVIAEFNEAHPGISRMKALARGYVWWPNMDREIEDAVKRCQ